MLRTGGVGGILVALVIAPSIAVALRACVVRRRIASAARPAVPSALPNSPSADRSGAISADAAKEDRVRAARLLAFFAGGATLALAFGWGRAGLVPTVGLPDRYVLLSAPLLVWAYVVAELYAGTAMRRGVQASLFVLAIVLLPPNTNRGLEWRQWYRTGMQSVVSDIEAGQPRRVLVERHGGFLMRWSPEKLAEGMDLLQRAHIGPFADMRPTP